MRSRLQSRVLATITAVTAIAATVLVAPPTALAQPGEGTTEVDQQIAGREIVPAGAPPEEPWDPAWFDGSTSASARSSTGGPALNFGTGITDYFSYETFPIFGDAMDLQVNLTTGNLFARSNIISYSGPGVPAALSVAYNSNSNGGDLGSWGTDAGLVGLRGTSGERTYVDGTGARWVFNLVNGQWRAPAGANATLQQTNGAFTLTYNRTGEVLSFNAGGYLVARKDRNGVGVTYGYNGNKLATITNAAGETIELEVELGDDRDYYGAYDEAGRSASFEVMPDIGAQGGMTRMVLPARGDFTLAYNSGGQLTTITNGNKQATITYSGRQVTSLTQAISGQTPVVVRFAYNATGTTVTDARGNLSTYEAGSFGVAVAIDQLNRHRETGWTLNGDVATTTNGFASGGTGVETTRTYDSLNNQTSVTLPTGAATQALYAQGPTCQGAQSTHPHLAKCTIDDAGNSQSMTYDAAGNLTERVNTTSGGASETFTYEREGAEHELCGGFPGQVCFARDGKNATTSYEYSHDGRLRMVMGPAGATETSYTYDPAGRVLTVQNLADHTTTYAYDRADRVVKVTYDNGSTLTTEYNFDGTVKKETDSATGTSIAYTYNVLGFQTKQMTTSTTAGLNQLATMTYDLSGNLTRLYDSVGAAEALYTYDAANQLTSAQLQGGNCSAANSPGCIRYEYDDNALEKARVFPFGARQDTIRDDSGRPTRITTKDKNGAVQNDIAYSYTLNGADSGSVRTRTSHKEQGITAGAVTTYGYDSRSRLTSAVEKTGTTTSASWTYQYDKADNRTRQVRTGATGATAGTINYTYDAANRLTGATGSSGAWTYDGAGNQTRNALTGVSSTYGDRLQATANGSTTYSTFGQGNDLQLKVTNNVQKYTTLGTYSTASDRTVSRDSDGTAIATRVGTTWAFLAADHLGSTTGLIGADGLYLGGYSYSPYGETRAASTNATVAGNTIRYIGQHLEPTTGLYKLGARYYDAALGRFTQMDPSGQERNPYSYAACDPINAKDPTGLEPNSCSVTLLGLGTVNGIIWGAAGVLAPTVAGGIVAGAAGAVLSLGIGIASLWC